MHATCTIKINSLTDKHSRNQLTLLYSVHLFCSSLFSVTRDWCSVLRSAYCPCRISSSDFVWTTDCCRLFFCCSSASIWSPYSCLRLFSTSKDSLKDPPRWSYPQPKITHVYRDYLHHIYHKIYLHFVIYSCKS